MCYGNNCICLADSWHCDVFVFEKHHVYNSDASCIFDPYFIALVVFLWCFDIVPFCGMVVPWLFAVQQYCVPHWCSCCPYMYAYADTVGAMFVGFIMFNVCSACVNSWYQKWIGKVLSTSRIALKLSLNMLIDFLAAFCLFICGGSFFLFNAILSHCVEELIWFIIVKYAFCYCHPLVFQLLHDFIICLAHFFLMIWFHWLDKNKVPIPFVHHHGLLISLAGHNQEFSCLFHVYYVFHVFNIYIISLLWFMDNMCAVLIFLVLCGWHSLQLLLHMPFSCFGWLQKMFCYGCCCEHWPGGKESCFYCFEPDWFCGESWYSMVIMDYLFCAWLFIYIINDLFCVLVLFMMA